MIDKELKRHFKSLYEIEMYSTSPVPNWVDSYSDKCILEHVIGISDKLDYGDEKTGDELLVKTEWSDNPLYKDKTFVYVDSLDGVHEMEIQKENGELEYEYLGQNYFRIWKPKEGMKK